MLALSIACTAAAVAWVYLVAAHGGYWRTSQRLPRVSGEPDAWPDVVAVVPARNEAAMLPVTLPALLGQDYPGLLTVIVVDDGSSDGTGLVAAAEGDDRDLVSQMALLRTAAGWERVVVPAFVYFFAQLYPFRRVNMPGSGTAAAAGGCMLIRRETLDKAGG